MTRASGRECCPRWSWSPTPASTTCSTSPSDPGSRTGGEPSQVVHKLIKHLHRKAAGDAILYDRGLTGAKKALMQRGTTLHLRWECLLRAACRHGLGQGRVCRWTVNKGPDISGNEGGAFVLQWMAEAGRQRRRTSSG